MNEHPSSAAGTLSSAQHLLSLVQGAFYVVTGLWPVLHIRSFEWLTGKKVDDWLVKTVGALIALAGGIVALPALRRQPPSEATIATAIGFPAILAAVDVIYYRRGILRFVYLIDAATEIALIAGWAVTLGRRRRPSS